MRRHRILRTICNCYRQKEDEIFCVLQVESGIAKLTAVHSLAGDNGRSGKYLVPWTIFYHPRGAAVIRGRPLIDKIRMMKELAHRIFNGILLFFILKMFDVASCPRQSAILLGIGHQHKELNLGSGQILASFKKLFMKLTLHLNSIKENEIGKTALAEIDARLPKVNCIMGAPFFVRSGFAQSSSTLDARSLLTATPELKMATTPMGAPGAPGATVIITSPGIMFGPRPVNLQCPHCGAQVVTQTVAQNGLITWLVCGALCLFGCSLGCCLIPFCVPELQDVDHTCPNCKNMLGSYRRFFKNKFFATPSHHAVAAKQGLGNVYLGKLVRGRIKYSINGLLITLHQVIQQRGADLLLGTQNTTMEKKVSNMYPQFTPVLKEKEREILRVQVGAKPEELICPYCSSRVVTDTKSRDGLTTWLSCLACCFCCCVLGCCLIPFCTPQLLDVDHYCPNCKNLVGEYRVIGGR
uniref:LITAF domain-containing protein n=1 Tax=Strigamia maritima TaxID=126957 RepID=T1JEX8_STRMM